jgi:hypothetical protein
MMGSSELGRISEEVEATSETSDGGAEVGAASGSGEDVGWATSDEGMNSVVLVAASGEAGTSDAAEEASDEGAGKRSETTELRADSTGAGLSEEAGATEVSACEVAASGEADDSATEATPVGVGEAAGFSVTTALVAATISSADEIKLVRDSPSEVGIVDSIVDGAEDSAAEGASGPGSWWALTWLDRLESWGMNEEIEDEENEEIEEEMGSPGYVGVGLVHAPDSLQEVLVASHEFEGVDTNCRAGSFGSIVPPDGTAVDTPNGTPIGFVALATPSWSALSAVAWLVQAVYAPSGPAEIPLLGMKVSAPLIPVAADEIGSKLAVLPVIVVGVGKPSGPHVVDVIAIRVEIAPSLPMTGGRLVGSPESVNGVSKPSGPQVVVTIAVLTKLVGTGMTRVGEPSAP